MKLFVMMVDAARRLKCLLIPADWIGGRIRALCPTPMFPSF